jgi:hypothetical protein
MISFIIPTVGRPSLAVTLASVETMPGDEILIVCDERVDIQPFVEGRAEARIVHCPPGNDWGHAERNFAMYIAHIDDDDTYAVGARALMADAIRETPGRPVLFRMQYPCGITLWRDPFIRCGNVGTPMMLIPNVPEKLGTWGSFVGGDCSFLEGSGWSSDEYVWRPEIIALLGHNVG